MSAYPTTQVQATPFMGERTFVTQGNRQCNIGPNAGPESLPFFADRTYVVQASWVASVDGTGNPSTYHLQGWDTGTEQMVYWSSFGTPNLAPAVTTPQFTGQIVQESICIIDTD